LNLISITGPESTGKSNLAEALASHYQTPWVKEYSRKYLAELGRSYNFDDIAEIARGQLIREQELMSKATPYLFCDTDMLVCKIWSKFKFGKVDPWLDSIVKRHRYDLYLLCDIDLPWTDDPLREHPHNRRELFDMYYFELNQIGVNFKIVSGFGSERLNKAISVIDNTFRYLP
jgi:NadR type nicotinamide-nucleotide adenylyltransferase